ncbi:MAG: hypothetical protein Q6L60_02250, partial [Thermostichus sp. HHBFW_bins_43]
ASGLLSMNSWRVRVVSICQSSLRPELSLPRFLNFISQIGLLYKSLGAKTMKLNLYKNGNSNWMFNDTSKDLYAEPFVEGSSEIFDCIAEQCNYKNNMCIEFGDCLEQWDYKLELIKKENGGAWYYCEDLDMSGWLCPALYKYFDYTPDVIYIQILEQ